MVLIKMIDLNRCNDLSIHRSKLAEGLKSWAKFGTQLTSVSGGGKADEFADITKAQVLMDYS